MLNKRIKEGINEIRRPEKRIRFGLGTLALIGLCVTLLIVSTFTQIKIDFGSSSGNASGFVFEYIPQIPVVLFIAALLGEFWGLIAVIIYIILGLTTDFAVFALGGGWSYIFRYNFGYIFGYIFAVILTAKYLKRNLTVWKFIKALFSGILAIHIVGIVYLSIIALFKHETPSFIANMIYYQSIAKIMYDIVFGIAAIISGRVAGRFAGLMLL